MNPFVIATFMLVLSVAVVLNGAKIKNKWTRWSLVKGGEEEYNKVKTTVSAGARMGLSECQTQFRYEKWNCTVQMNRVPVFIRTGLPYANRETSFLHAISSAGVTYSLIRSCRQGHFKDCSCAKMRKPKKSRIARKNRDGGQKPEDSFIWDGCGDNYHFGAAVGRQFIDALETSNDARSVLNRHNNEVGRKAVKSSLTRECKCHGVSGSCQTKSCWVRLSSFREIGNYLKRKYKTAKKAKYSDKKLRQKSSVGYRSLKEREYELLYMVASPNYCVRNLAVGSTGVAGRVCTADKSSQATCDNLCTSCQLLPTKVTEKQTVQCSCKFIWCCHVQCKTCQKFVTKTTCRR